jgi:hypothetical protein
MSLILQTMVTNKLEQGRTLRWAGKRGVYLEGGESRIIEGAYPTACRNNQGIKAMESEIAQGLIEVKLVTNIDVVKPVGGKGAVSNPTAVKEAANTVAKEEAVPLTEYPSNKEERFHTVEDGKNPLEPTTVTLPGNDIEEIPEPVKAEIFPEGTTLAQEGQKTIEPVADAPAEAEESPAEEAAEEAPAEAAAEEAAPPKKRRRRTKKKTEAAEASE